MLQIIKDLHISGKYFWHIVTAAHRQGVQWKEVEVVDVDLERSRAGCFSQQQMSLDKYEEYLFIKQFNTRYH